MIDPSPERRPPLGRFEKLFLAGFAVVIGGGFLLATFQDYTPVKLSVLFFLAAWFPLVVVHEGGHALVARACGWRVSRLVVGFGRAMWAGRVGGVPVSIGVLPLGGFCRLRPLDLRWPRLKSAAIYLAGPLAELAVAGGLRLALGPALTHGSQAVPMIAAQAVAAAALVGGVVNLLPFPAQVGGSGEYAPSDGLGVLLSLTRSRAHFAAWMAQTDEDE